ncbi:Tat pathway signal protein [Pelagibius litoralis]|uniref:Tat pathway signal protein n=2 Tax=Pelagibius litoralis TaxID=374515 RepID=A0A967KAA8_9PROT|nr:Tat pathway signal protein [Pelagibius litoralis]
MLDRRRFIGSSALGGAALLLGGCSYDPTAYQAAVAEMTRPLPVNPDFRELVRYATLAANGHNTQPWTFRLQERGIDILPDFTRRTPVVDPDDHHLFASLGCAAENLAIAAKARGMAGDVIFESIGQGHISVDLSPAPREETGLFAAIPARQCSRAAYDGKAVPGAILDRLPLAAKRYAVETILLTDDKSREDILALVIEGNSRQMDDPAFLAELKHWIRFNPGHALAAGDGIYSATSGNPELPRWIGAPLFDLFFDKDSENDKYAAQIRSSAGVAVFVARTDDREGWFNAGRAYQRFALQATADGLKQAFVNQAVEVPAVRGELQTLLRIGGRRPNLVVRFGYGPRLPKSLRRPLEAVIA